MVITAVEPNAQHGTGNYLRQICPKQKNVRYIFYRELSTYNNICDVDGEHKVIPKKIKFGFIDMLKFKLKKVQKILIFPFYENMAHFALFAQKVTGAELITYFLDDSNIYVKNISDSTVKKLLKKSSKRFTISKEMNLAYQKKFTQKCHVLHPKIAKRNCYFENSYLLKNKKFINCGLLGNIWSIERFNQILTILKALKLKTLWFGLGPEAPWLNLNNKNLRKNNILTPGNLHEKILFQKISNLPFVIIPTGSLEKNDSRKEISKFSMPSRLFFCCAHTNTPIFVLGSHGTAVAKFVTEHKIGVCSGNDIQKSRRALAKILKKQNHDFYKQNLLRLKDLFVDESLPHKAWNIT